MRYLKIATAALAPFFAIQTAAVAADSADVIYMGGIIITVNDAQPSAEAVAVKDGKILAVGARADLDTAYKGDKTQVIDLAGKTMTPGFLDPHSHYINALTVANQVNVFAPPAGPGKDPCKLVRCKPLKARVVGLRRTVYRALVGSDRLVPDRAV